MDEGVKVILNKVEASGIADISSILNEATEKFANSDMKLVDYKEILIRIAKRADKLAHEIYDKNSEDPKTRRVDVEEYRTLLDISRECRDGIREIVLLRSFDEEIV